MLRITSEKKNDTVIVFVDGRVDSTNAGELENGIQNADVAPKLIIDIEKMEYMSSAGLRVLLKFRKLHPDLEVINASTDVYEVFDMTGFTEMMTIKRAYKHVSIDGCEVIGQGANGMIYRIDPDTIVKVYKNLDSLDVIEHERDVARKALVLGIPTAISYDIVKVGDDYASMFEMLNANSMSGLIAENPQEIDTYSKIYADLLKLIHGTEVPEGQLPDQREVLIGWIKDLESHFPKDVFDKILALATAIPKDNHMIHGDYHTKNIMMQNGEAILIDMDTLAVGHPVLEFASMYNAYLGFSALDHTETARFLGFDYEYGRKLWDNTLKLYYNTDDKEVLEYREKQAKMLGYIRIYRRSLRRNNNKELASYCKEELIKLVAEIDSLI